jgi:hypothetical protein
MTSLKTDETKMSKKRTMTAQDVVNRMQGGDLPVVNSSFSSASVFDDGVEVPHQTMQLAAHQMNLLEVPARGARWPAPIPAEPINA